MLTSLKILLHPYFVLRNQFLNFFACVTLCVSPDIAAHVVMRVFSHLVCTASVEVVCKEKAAFGLAKEFQQLQHFCVAALVMEEAPYRELLLGIQSCSHFWKQCMPCVVLSR